MSEKEFFNEAFVEYFDQYNTANPKHPLTQSGLARILDVNKATITNWKKGSARPDSRQDVLNIASALRLKRDQADNLLRLSEYTLTNDEEARKLRGGEVNPPHANSLAPFIKERCPDFYVERPALLVEIHQLFFTSPTPNNLVVNGIGGTGKTVLVASFLNQSEAQLLKIFRDGVVWIDLENSLIDPLLQISDQLGLPSLSAPNDDLRETIIQQARKRKMLWVIDGSETTGDAVPWLDLVRAAQGKFIVTLREWPDPGWLSQRVAKLIRVGDFEASEGLQMAENILQTSLAGNELSGWEELAHQVSYHPLSIRILAGCAYFDPTPQRWDSLAQDLLRLGTLAIQLGDGQQTADKSDSVHHCLEISYERLKQRNPAAASCFRALGILSSSEIQPMLLNSLMDDNGNANRVLAALAQAGMIELNRSTNSYRMHSLLRLFAHTLLEQSPIEYGLVGTRYIKALIAHLETVPGDIKFQVHDPLLGEYLHAVQVACQIGLIGDLLNLLYRTYPILLGMGQSEALINNILNILPIFQQVDELKGEPLAWLCKAYGDTLLVRLEVEQALVQYKRVLERTKNPVLLFRTHLQRAACAHIMDHPMDVLQEIGAAEQLFDLLPGEQRDALIQEYRLALRAMGSSQPEAAYGPNTISGSLTERLYTAHNLLENGHLDDGTSLLETLDQELGSAPLIHYRGDVLQSLAHGYLQKGDYALANQVLDRLEKLLQGAAASPDTSLLWAQLWQHRGHYEFQMNHFELARQHLLKSQEYWKIVPDSASFQQNILAILKSIEKY